MNGPGAAVTRLVTNAVRLYLTGPSQPWCFRPIAPGWKPAVSGSTSLYLHVPFCRHSCPYCPYTKVPYDPALVEPYTRTALAEVNWWADAVGPVEITSVYVGGGTPTLALSAVAAILARVRERFRLRGPIGIETNPADVSEDTVRQLEAMGVTLVSVGVQSFAPDQLALLGRAYRAPQADRALAMLAGAGFAAVNADLMFALPGQSAGDVVADMARAARLGAHQVTTYPLFTFPYTAVGTYRRLKAVRMPHLQVRRQHYRAINRWCRDNGYERVSVWGFKRDAVPRYSSVTRDSYIGIGPGAGSLLEGGFAFNTFSLGSWLQTLEAGQPAIALQLPFTARLQGWWWLYWRLYDTRIPLDRLNEAMGDEAGRARTWLGAAQRLGMATRHGEWLELTDRGAFWLHLAQNYFALNYVNTLWTKARSDPWPRAVTI